LEENERMKKRQKAQQIFSLSYKEDVIDQDLPNIQHNITIVHGSSRDKSESGK
jgi:hypothetical protein